MIERIVQNNKTKKNEKYVGEILERSYLKKSRLRAFVRTQAKNSLLET